MGEIKAMTLCEIAGKTVHRVDEDSWSMPLIYFTDGTVMTITGDEPDIEFYSSEQMASKIADKKRAEAIMERAWKEHREAMSNPVRISAGWGGFYRLPTADPWPDWRDDVKWLDAYSNNGRSSFEEDIERSKYRNPHYV